MPNALSAKMDVSINIILYKRKGIDHFDACVLGVNFTLRESIPFSDELLIVWHFHLPHSQSIVIVVISDSNPVHGPKYSKAKHLISDGLWTPGDCFSFFIMRMQEGQRGSFWLHHYSPLVVLSCLYWNHFAIWTAVSLHCTSWGHQEASSGNNNLKDRIREVLWVNTWTNKLLLFI